MINSALAAYYYLGVIVTMYMQEEEHRAPSAAVPVATASVLLLTIVGTFYLGIFPSQVLAWASLSADIFK
jgi:NADH-quinone oxidoreductase subunit N